MECKGEQPVDKFTKIVPKSSDSVLDGKKTTQRGCAESLLLAGGSDLLHHIYYDKIHRLTLSLVSFCDNLLIILPCSASFL